MAYLKKVHPEWSPAEKRDIQVGEVMEFNGPYVELVKGGMAILVDGSGNELELPGQKLTCPICFNEIEGLYNFVDHVSGHGKKSKVAVSPVEVEEAPTVTPEVKTLTESVNEELEKQKAEDLKAKRMAALEKARAARKGKKA